MLVKPFLVAAILVCINALEFNIPPFLYGAPESVIDSYVNMASSSGDLYDPEIENRVEKWVSRQSPDIKSKFAVFRAEEKEGLKFNENAEAEMASKLSPEAQIALQKLSFIHYNRKLYSFEKFQQIQNIKNSLPANIVQEIDQHFQNLMLRNQMQEDEMHDIVMAKLSPMAKKADGKIYAIHNDPMISPDQKIVQIQKILNSLPKSVQDELQSVMSG